MPWNIEEKAKQKVMKTAEEKADGKAE
jgi:hypothetical protein